MSEHTPLDHAHIAMEAAPDDVEKRLKYFERLADSELFMLLTEEASDASVKPELFELADASFVLVFDREERLGTFVGKPAPYVALSGRVIAGMLAGQGIGFALNPEVAPSSNIIDPEAVAWLSNTVSTTPELHEAKPEELTTPNVPEILITALSEKLATATGLADSAYLVGVAYENGRKGHLLGVIDAPSDAQGAIAQAFNEALTFSGLEAAALDVAFFASSDPIAAKLAKAGLRFDLPQPAPTTEYVQKAPGSDPERPPKLR